MSLTKTLKKSREVHTEFVRVLDCFIYPASLGDYCRKWFGNPKKCRWSQSCLYGVTMIAKKVCCAQQLQVGTEIRSLRYLWTLLSWYIVRWQNWCVWCSDPLCKSIRSKMWLTSRTCLYRLGLCRMICIFCYVSHQQGFPILVQQLCKHCWPNPFHNWLNMYSSLCRIWKSMRCW